MTFSPSIRGWTPPSEPSGRMRISLPRGTAGTTGAGADMYIVRAGEAEDGAAEAPLGMRAPQEPQNAKPGLTGRPQVGQMRPSEASGVGAVETAGGAENDGSGAFPPCEITPAADVREPGAAGGTG